MATYTATQYTHRYLARFIIEAKTPLAVGAGERDFFTDALVATDVNGMPYIPASSIAGVVRSMVSHEETLQIFGKQGARSKDCKGSEIIFTEAKILDANGKVVDGLHPEHIQSDSLLRAFQVLPIRQHVRLTDKGATEKMGKFDEQVVFPGARFCFELEMVSDGTNNALFQEVINRFQMHTFRIGGGTRKGFGEIEVVKAYTRTLDLRQAEDLNLYLDKSSELAAPWSGWEEAQFNDASSDSKWVEYQLQLTPEDFFLFSSGFGDEDADISPVKTSKVEWNKDSKGALVDNLTLVPATSLKGAISHRLAYHWNKLSGTFIKTGQSGEDVTSAVRANNFAVRTLFGFEDGKTKVQKRGNVILSDMILTPSFDDKIMNHVTIDRFTGGAIEGHLFSEKVTCGRGVSVELSIWVLQEALQVSNDKGVMVKDAFEHTLNDICRGLLPLGGGVNRGNGAFTGSFKVNS